MVYSESVKFEEKNVKIDSKMTRFWPVFGVPVQKTTCFPPVQLFLVVLTISAHFGSFLGHFLTFFCGLLKNPVSFWRNSLKTAQKRHFWSFLVTFRVFWPKTAQNGCKSENLGFLVKKGSLFGRFWPFLVILAILGHFGRFGPFWTLF